MSEVIRKTVLLLQTIQPNENKEEWSTTEISKKLGIPVQTVHRLLTCLEEYGFVYKNKQTRKFRLGLTLLQLGLSIRDNLSVRNAAVPIMEKLAQKTKESVYLTVPEGCEGVFIDCVDSPHWLRIVEPIGMRLPLCVGASKKVILAYLEEKTRSQVIKDLVKNGRIKDVDHLHRHLMLIRKHGYCISFGETTEGTASVAAPIFSWENKVIASLSVAGPETRFTKDELAGLISTTIRAANEISEELGWVPNR
ncbi:IclR family transcriptional regulator [Aeribacillus pallidus]|nr:IclR family transcriptional regulator [Aeribacillus pallidus]